MSPPATLGRYTLLRRLAAGGMGEVYLAESQGAAGFSRLVAIKRILPHLARDEDFVRKFIDEANIMVQLHHGNIVGVQELADHDGELYIVMEYLPGRDLKAVAQRLRQRRERMPAELALWLCAEICAALDYAHRKTGPDGHPMGIVHRDVSPSNVVLGSGGEVKLLDFGIARARGRLHQSISGTLQGKFVYMSPEQADGRPVDARSDVFSAGLLLYELLTGVRPFDGESETETLRKVRMARIDPPSSIGHVDGTSGISSGGAIGADTLDTLVMKALAPDPDARYETAADMRRSILHLLADCRSLMDARHLADFLSRIYPEGVAPSQTPDPPLSIDDALALQLGALTPSVNPMTRTRTADPAPGHVTPRGGGPVTPTTGRSDAAARTRPPADDHDLGRSDAAFPRVTVPPLGPAVVSARGVKRTLTLGLVLGALIATGAALWWTRRGEATLEPVVAGPEVWEVLVNDGLLLRGARLPVGERLKVCVRAEGFVEQCPSLVLTRGVNRPVFTLAPSPVLEVTVLPPTAGVRIFAGGLEVDRQPYPLRPGKGYDVCLADWPAGLEPETRCQAIERAESGRYALMFHLVPARPAPLVDAGVPAPKPDAGVADPPDRGRPTPRPRWTELQLISTPEAMVTCDDGTTGKTPLTVNARGEAVHCRLTAEGYLPADHVVEPGLGNRRHTLVLVKPALLSARAEPGAARLLVDGRLQPDSYVQRMALAPGRHRLEAVIEKDGRTYRAEEKIELTSGEEKSILVRIADYPAGGSEP